MLYVTHHFEEISQELFDKCLLLRNGQIYQMGSVTEVINSENISDFLQRKVTVVQMKNGYYQLDFQR